MVLSGEVDSVGPDAQSFQVGQPVFGFNRHRFGTYAQYVCWPEDGLLAPRPADLTDLEAAAVPYGGLLALSFLRKAGVRAGQRVLVFGASGAVGTSAVQPHDTPAPKSRVSAALERDLVASLGATTVIDYTRETHGQGRAFDLILDVVGKRKSVALWRCRQVLAPGASVSVDDGNQLRREDLRCSAAGHEGEIRPVIDRTYALDTRRRA
jgi:NADPH:quinone reductase-like Zn-dependent oxidoreductase